jgi:hypothetical protein
MSNPPYFSSMALSTSKLHWPDLGSDFKLNGLEIGTLSSEFSENSNAEHPRSQTVLATLSRKLLKIGSKRLLLGSMLQTKHHPLGADTFHTVLSDSIRELQVRPMV